MSTELAKDEATESVSLSVAATDESCRLEFIEIVPLAVDTDGRRATKCGSSDWSESEKTPLTKVSDGQRKTESGSDSVADGMAVAASTVGDSCKLAGDTDATCVSVPLARNTHNPSTTNSDSTDWSQCEIIPLAILSDCQCTTESGSDNVADSMEDGDSCKLAGDTDETRVSESGSRSSAVPLARDTDDHCATKSDSADWSETVPFSRVADRLCTAQLDNGKFSASEPVTESVADESGKHEHTEVVSLTTDSDPSTTMECDSKDCSAEVRDEILPAVKRESVDVSSVTCKLFVVSVTGSVISVMVFQFQFQLQL